MNDKLKNIIRVVLLIVILVLIYFSIKSQNTLLENKKISQGIFAMDTYMEIQAYGDTANEAISAAIKEIQRLDALLSTGSDESEVSVLNKNKTGRVSDDYAYLLQRSKGLWESTQGAFDITIYPVMRAWGFSDKDYRVPSDEEINNLLKNTDASKINFDEETNTVLIPENMEVDFGGIAKGYTSDKVAWILKEYKTESALINLGGNVWALGAKPDGSLWKVAIKNPYKKGEYIGVVSVKDKAVITSGGYERYFEKDGESYHHIINPENGKPAKGGLASVTIVSNDATLADGLSTALYVMGMDKAINYWKEYNQEFEAVLCDDLGMIYVTEGLEGYFSSDLEYKIVRK